MTPIPAPKALEQYYLEARSKLLDLAAILDRIGRGENATAAGSDTRVAKIEKALAILKSNAPHKAEQIQQIFSQEYDPNWKRPEPRL